MHVLVVIFGLLCLSLCQVFHFSVYLWCPGLFIKRCTGLDSIPWVGVLQWSSIAMYRFVLGSRAFRIRFFVVFTTDSTFPFALLLPGLLVPCSKSHSLANLVNSDEMNCGPLSLIKRSGQLYHAKWFLSFRIMTAEVALVRQSTSQKLL